jgi:hypothetical protein
MRLVSAFKVEEEELEDARIREKTKSVQGR